MQAHSQAPPYSFGGAEGLSAQQLYARVLEKYTDQAPIEGANPCCSWYHLVIGACSAQHCSELIVLQGTTLDTMATDGPTCTLQIYSRRWHQHLLACSQHIQAPSCAIRFWARALLGRELACCALSWVANHPKKLGASETGSNNCTPGRIASPRSEAPKRKTILYHETFNMR